MKKSACALMVMALGFTAAASGEPYEPNWESLSKHEIPEWFRDAKFGIYTHWGPVTVGSEKSPTNVGWYGRQLYEKANPAFKYHKERFGDQNDFGYKDVVPLFTAEKFDAEVWADLFAASGARFAGPVAVHHDNFANWDSDVTPWNSVDMGPHRDITGELARAFRKRGMKFMAAFHHGFTWRYFEPAFAFDAKDGQHIELYTEPHGKDDAPTERFLNQWLAMVNEAVGKYQPDLLWFDFGLGSVVPPEYQRRMFAGYYNWAAEKGLEVGVAHKHRDIHAHTGILDFERGREDRLVAYPWLTDTSIGPWFHHDSGDYTTVNNLVDILIDIVSKNGCMLLNVGPRADGSIPEVGRDLLLGMGEWLKVNGEAIYGTRPWEIYGEGPSQIKRGAFNEHADFRYTGQDLRFTRSKDGKTLYIVALDWPGERIVVESMRLEGVSPETKVSLLGCDAPLTLRTDEEGHLMMDLRNVPPSKRGQHAFAFKLGGCEITRHPDSAFHGPGVIRIEPGRVTCEGTQVRLQTTEGRENIGYWDRSNESLHWLVYLTEAGTYTVRGEFSAAAGPSALAVTIAGDSAKVDIPKTKAWTTPEVLPIGEFDVKEPGVHRVALSPADPKKWKPVNVYGLQLAPKE